MNAHRLHALDGALDGVDWTFDWDADDLMPDVFGLAWPDELLYFHLLRQDVLYGLENVGRIPDWLQSYILDGTMPSPAEVIAFHLFTSAQRDEPINKWLWDRLNDSLGEGEWPEYLREMGTFFDDGSPLLPSEWRDADGDSEAQRPISNLADLMQAMDRIYEYAQGERHGVVEVRVTIGEDGKPNFIAIVPGTTIPMNVPEGWHEHTHGTDWTANIRAKAYGSSAAIESATAAIDAAIRQYEIDHNGGQPLERPDVVLAGHSQGGLNVATIAADPSFAERYNVPYVVTAGSPIRDIEVPSHTTVVAFANEGDSTVDLAGNGEKLADLGRDMLNEKFWRLGDALVPELDTWTAPSNVHEIHYTDAQYPGTPRLDGDNDWAHGHRQDTYQYRIEQALAEEGSSTAEFNEMMAEHFATVGPDEVYHIEYGRTP